MFPIVNPSPGTNASNVVATNGSDHDNIPSNTDGLKLSNSGSNPDSSTAVPFVHSTIFVGDLSVFCSEDDLSKLFGQYGGLKDVRIIRENKSHQPLFYGFVEFYDHAVAQQAMSSLNGHLFMGRRMRVSWATTPASPRANASDKKQSGVNGDDNSKSHAIPTSKSESNRSMPQREYSNKSGVTASSSSSMSISQFNSSNSSQKDRDRRLPAVQVLFSFISNQLDMLVTEEFIGQVFGEFGTLNDVCIKKININKGSNTQNGYGFVHYECSHKGIQSALQAVSWFHRRVIQHVKFDCKISHQFQQFLDDEENLKAHLGEEPVLEAREFAYVETPHHRENRMNRGQHNNLSIVAPVYSSNANKTRHSDMTSSNHDTYQQHEQRSVGQPLQNCPPQLNQLHQTLPGNIGPILPSSSPALYYTVYPSAPVLVTPSQQSDQSMMTYHQANNNRSSSGFASAHQVPISDIANFQRPLQQLHYISADVRNAYYHNSTVSLNSGNSVSASPIHGYPAQMYVTVPSAMMSSSLPMQYLPAHGIASPSPQYSAQSVSATHYAATGVFGSPGGVVYQNNSNGTVYPPLPPHQSLYGQNMPDGPQHHYYTQQQ